MEWIVLFAIIALLLVVVLLLILGAPGRGTREYRFGGLLWLVSGRSYWGPTCESCCAQYGLRPVFRSPDGTAYYELHCPRCHKKFPGQAFTVQALLELDRQVAVRLKGRKRVVPLTTPAEQKPPFS